MIDAIITFSIRHRALVIAASLILAVLGLWAAWLTPVDAIPDLSENQVIVFADWKGHGPREVENQLTYPLALGLQGLRGVRVVRSSSDVGFATISVIFDDGVEFQEARRRVAERLARIGGDLPSGVSPHLAPDSLATGQIFWYTVEGAGLDLGRLQVHPGLVRQAAARLGGRRGRGFERRRLSHRVSGSHRPAQASGGRNHARRGAGRGRRIELGGGRTRRDQGQGRIRRARGRLAGCIPPRR